jgi:hypothetical protein
MMGQGHCAVAISAADADLSAKRAAVDLLRATEVVRLGHRSTPLSPAMGALFDAATYFALTGTMAGWAADIAEPTYTDDGHTGAIGAAATHLHLVNSEQGSPR